MVPRIRQLLHATPFEPFTIQASNGQEYAVPTADHAHVHPKGSPVIVFFDDETQIQLSALHIVGVTEKTLS